MRWMSLERSGNMIRFLIKLMFFPIYIVFWLIALPFKILFFPFRTRDKEHMGLFSTLGWCLLFQDLFD